MKNLYTQEEVVKKIVDFCLEKYKVIFISGNGGSGKTTLSQSMVKEINTRGFGANCIDMDEFMIDSEIRKNTIKEWVDAQGIKRIGYLTWAFKESYDIDSLEILIRSLMNGKDCSYKSRKNDKLIELKSEFPLTIIEGVGTAFLKKEDSVFGVFVTCDFNNEVDRRIARARDGETNLSREEVEKKAVERNEQFEVTILQERNKFDLELWSLEDHSLRIDRDDLKVLKSL